MKRYIGLTGVCVLLCATGCSESDPIALFGPQTLEVNTRTLAPVQEFLVWDFYRDGTTDISGNGSVGPEDVDGIPDDVTGDGLPDLFLVCEASGQVFPDRTVPWPFSVKISILRAGSTEPELLHDPMFSIAFDSLTVYNTGTSTSGQAAPSFALANPSPHRVYTNPRKLTAGHRVVIEAPQFPDPTVDTPQSPADDPIDPADPGREYCPFGVSLGEPGTAGISPPPFPVDLAGGDTLILEARMAPSANVQYNGNPGMVAEIVLDGEALPTTGACSSGNAIGAGFTCSYTSR